MKTLETIDITLRNVPLITDTKKYINYEIPIDSQPPDHYLANVCFGIPDTGFKLKTEYIKGCRLKTEYIREWCKQYCNSFYQISNPTYTNVPPFGIKVIFYIRFADKNDLLKFKIAWG